MKNHSKICKTCNKKFKTYDSEQPYCSVSCKFKALEGCSSTCPNCEGQGYSIEGSYSGSEDIENSCYTVSCELCEGTGRTG